MGLSRGLALGAAKRRRSAPLLRCVSVVCRLEWLPTDVLVIYLLAGGMSIAYACTCGYREHTEPLIADHTTFAVGARQGPRARFNRAAHAIARRKMREKRLCAQVCALARHQVHDCMRISAGYMCCSMFVSMRVRMLVRIYSCVCVCACVFVCLSWRLCVHMHARLGDACVCATWHLGMCRLKSLPGARRLLGIPQGAQRSRARSAPLPSGVVFRRQVRTPFLGPGPLVA